MSGRFSTFVVKALADVVTGGAGQGPDVTEPVGIYRSGPKIEALFLDCGLDMRIGSSSRVPATIQFLRDLANHWDGDDAIKRVMLRVCDPREYLSAPEKAVATRQHLNAALEADGLAITVVSGTAHLVERTAAGLVVEPFISKVATLDFDTVQVEIARALPSLSADPEDAVTAACSLIEAVCRSILIELQLPLPAKRDVDGLLKAVQEPLGLSPGRTDLPSEIEQDVRQVLGGLTSVIKGVGALRTHGGDAHGREKGFRRIDPRIARLALNSASSIALFLIETWESKQHRHLPQHGENG
jgi:hypothetical protein